MPEYLCFRFLIIVFSWNVKLEAHEKHQSRKKKVQAALKERRELGSFCCLIKQCGRE